MLKHNGCVFSVYITDARDTETAKNRALDISLEECRNAQFFDIHFNPVKNEYVVFFVISPPK